MTDPIETVELPRFPTRAMIEAGTAQTLRSAGKHLREFDAADELHRARGEAIAVYLAMIGAL